MKQWFVETPDGVTGPLTPSELAQWIQQGRLLPGQRVSCDGSTWMPASAVQELLAGASGKTSDATQQGTIQEMRATFPGYLLMGVLGSGGGGVVYKARQLKLGRLVALKTVPVTRATSETFLKRFRQEAEVLARLSHPNIVQVFDCACDDSGAWYVMELLAGEDLDARIQRCGPLDERAAWLIARQAAVALAYASREGIYHRDIKPSNLFLVSSCGNLGLPADVPLVKVTDFGLALTREALADAPDSRLTAAGVVLGTPAYMSPEQCKSPQVDHRADIYSLGATVFHALSGHPPFSGQTAWDIMTQKICSPRLGLPASAESIELVAAMMAVDPAERVGSYEELLRRIDALPMLVGMSAQPSPPPRAPGRARWWPWLAVGVLAAALLSGAWLAWRTWTARPLAVEYEATDTSEHLFDGKTMRLWSPTGGQAWSIELDGEGTTVLTGKGGVRRPFRAYLPDFRVTLALDLFKADACEVALDGPTPDMVLRISRKEGAIAGRWVGARERFEPLGPAAPFPSAEALEGRTPYLNVRFQQAAGRRVISFEGNQVADYPAEGAKAMSLTVTPEGGPVRVETATHEEILPVKER
jgi:hypothetical protein